MMTGAPRTLAVLALCSSLLLLGFVGLFGGDLLTDETQVDVETPDEVDALREAGHTGSDVAVGVVDVTGVDTDNPAVEDQLVSARTFGESDRLRWTRPDEHGTATSALTSGVAPDAELYFASVADEQSFEEAVNWLVEEDVDVIVAPLSFYGKPGDGTAFVERAAAEAVEAGTVVVTPAGNVGQGHWQSRLLPDSDGKQLFGDSSRNQLQGDGEELVLWLSWSNPNVDLSLELYRGDEPEPVERSVRYDGDAYPNERIVTTVEPDEPLSFAVRGEEAATGTAVRVTSPTHEFDISQHPGSLVPPGTARGVLTVGAYDLGTGIVEPFSAAGPTADDRTGVDIVAPNRFEMGGEREAFRGTSAAAPYVGGIVALLLEADPTLTPEGVSQILGATADSSPPYDDPHRVGGGLLEPADAVAAAVERSTAGDE